MAPRSVAGGRSKSITRKRVQQRSGKKPHHRAPAQPTVIYRVGMRVPQTAQLYEAPETVAVEVPAIKAYKYMMVNDQVVLVDPATGDVVAELAD